MGGTWGRHLLAEQEKKACWVTMVMGTGTNGVETPLKTGLPAAVFMDIAAGLNQTLRMPFSNGCAGLFPLHGHC